MSTTKEIANEIVEAKKGNEINVIVNDLSYECPSSEIKPTKYVQYGVLDHNWDIQEHERLWRGYHNGNFYGYGNPPNVSVGQFCKIRIVDGEVVQFNGVTFDYKIHWTVELV